MPTPTVLDSTNGVRLATYDFGGSGSLVVLCHATGFCAGAYEPMIDRLVSAHHVVGLDVRAHGSSSAPVDGDLHWRGMGEDLLALIDHTVGSLGGPGAEGEDVAPPVRAFGHSMGGCAILQAELLRPGTFQSAWAFEPIVFERPSGEAPVSSSPLVEGARRRRAVFESREAVFERYSSRPPFSGIDERALRAYIRHGFADQPDGSVRLRCEPEDEAGTFEQSFPGVAERVHEIEMPLMIAASGDGQAPAQVALQLPTRNEWFELTRYDDLTHFGPFEQPERIAEDMMAWFADH